MARRFSGGKLLIASHNAGKVREIGALLAPFSVETVSAAALGLDEPEETETTFAGNARLKARAAARAADMICLADDSGLCVDALGGDPGIYSARWAGPTKDFSLAMGKVEDALQRKGATQAEQRGAQFVCVLSLAWPDGHAEDFEGVLPGQLVWPPRGTNGFGYDPVFVPEGYDITCGEMEPARKHSISHRARAFEKLIHACFAG